MNINTSCTDNVIVKTPNYFIHDSYTLEQITIST